MGTSTTLSLLSKEDPYIHSNVIFRQGKRAAITQMLVRPSARFDLHCWPSARYPFKYCPGSKSHHSNMMYQSGDCLVLPDLQTWHLEEKKSWGDGGGFKTDIYEWP